MAKNNAPTPTFPDPNNPPGWITDGDWEKPDGGSDPQLEQRVSDLEQSTEALGQSVTQNEGDIVGLQATAEEQGTEINGLKTVTTDLQTGQANLNTRVTALEQGGGGGGGIAYSGTTAGQTTILSLPTMNEPEAYYAIQIPTTTFDASLHDAVALIVSVEYQANNAPYRQSMDIQIPLFNPKSKYRTAKSSSVVVCVDKNINDKRFWADFVFGATISSTKQVTVGLSVVPHAIANNQMRFYVYNATVVYLE